MNRFHRHIPNFCDDRGMDRTPFEFETKEQLFASQYVKDWTKDLGARKFVGFRMRDRHLMAVHDDGFHYWVVGSVEKPVEGIEPWAGWKFRAMLKDGTVKVVSGDEIRSSCGAVLTLADGTLALDVTDGVKPDSAVRASDLKHPHETWFVQSNEGGEWKAADGPGSAVQFYNQDTDSVSKGNSIFDPGIPDPTAISKHLKGIGGPKQ